MAVAPVRGPSAQTILKLTWDYPVYHVPVVEVEGRTVAKRAKMALTEEQALAYIAGDDMRPLLVLRECKVCNGTDDALLSRGDLDNEKIFLLSRWFHCVKLPVDVLQEDHPFHNLFLPADDAPHMFMAASDGTNRVNLESDKSRRELKRSMGAVLKSQYKKGPDKQLKAMAKSIDKFDLVDQEILVLEKKIDHVMEEDGPKSRKLKKLHPKLADAQAERQKLFREIDQATTVLKLRVSEKAKDKSGASGAGS